MVLSDDAYSWYSDIDGELGTGREIMATLSVGQHTITLTGEDSVGLTSTVSNIVNISHFSEQSYFPLPQNGSWAYQYESPELITTNERGETERWTLGNMTVTSEDITSRTCSMEWMVECDGDSYECQYSVTDNIVLDDTCFQITESYETFASYKDTVQIEEMNVETAYTPSCPLITDYL